MADVLGNIEWQQSKFQTKCSTYYTECDLGRCMTHEQIVLLLWINLMNQD